LDLETLKTAMVGRVDAQRLRLEALAKKIHDNPELGFNELQASTWLTDYLKENGFSVERGICQLPTAFRASYGSGRPVIALIAEYDALPGLGHACGHNISCNISVGAAVAAKPAVDQSSGCVVVIGTPAEELYGGKVTMSQKGAFKGLDAAMMVHAGTANMATIQALACQNLDVEFIGRSAHAAASPEKGINALDAMILSFNAIDSLRQHIKSTARIHGIITDGGYAPNIVPDHSAGKFIVRAEMDDYLDELKVKVLNCFNGAATATGARLKHEWDELRYAPMKNNLALARLFADNMHRIGRQTELLDNSGAFGSTDMGNVSQQAPALHAIVAITPADIQLHSPEFAVAAASESAIDGLCDAAKSLAMTVSELLADPDMMNRVTEEYNKG
jgi:amidohydrolase